MNVPAKPSLISMLALKYNMEPEVFYKTIQKTVMPGNATVEQTAALLMVAHQYDLNPILKQIYAFPSKSGGITPIISIDGWCELINRQPAFDGMEFEDHVADGKVYAITCRMHRKDRSKPTMVTEYLDECQRATDPWRTSPKRMLRHRAMIQCARYSFGLSAAFDEGSHLVEVEGANVEVDMEPIKRQVAPPPPAPKKAEKAPEWASKATAEEAKVHEAHDPETGEVLDPEAFLTDLDEALATAKAVEELSTIYADFDVQTTLHAHPEHYERAHGFLQWYSDKLGKRQ